MQNVRMEPPCHDILHFAFYNFHFAVNMEGESPAEPSGLDTGDHRVPDAQPVARGLKPVNVHVHVHDGMIICSQLLRVRVGVNADLGD